MALQTEKIAGLPLKGVKQSLTNIERKKNVSFGEDFRGEGVGLEVIRIQIYLPSAGVVYVETIRVKKHRNRIKSMSSKLFHYSRER